MLPVYLIFFTLIGFAALHRFNILHVNTLYSILFRIATLTDGFLIYVFVALAAAQNQLPLQAVLKIYPCIPKN